MSPQGHESLGIRVIELLDKASYSTTYKLATLLGLIEVLRESASASGAYPDKVSGTAVADKVFERYWHQSVPYPSAFGQINGYLKQSPQRDIPQIIGDYRAKTKNISKNSSIDAAEAIDPEGMASLRKDVRQRILKMPIPRLQKFGSSNNWIEDRFLFDYDWEEDKIPQDDSLVLKQGVAEGLMATQLLLRPYIETLWTSYVAERNTHLTDASNLRAALFGGTRTDTTPLREPLRTIQNGLCFYCENQVTGSGDVDHFLPYSHFRNEDLDNFVLACSACNNSKSSSLASLKHLKKLLDRNQSCPTLDELAESLVWPRRTQQVVSIASSGYHSVAGAKLWLSPGIYEDLDVNLATSLFMGFQSITGN